MRLDALHHITMITADAQTRVDFAADVLGLRLVKQTVNFDAPDSYHLYFGDEAGSAGSLLTWFEFPDAARGRAGSGMVHTIQLAVPSTASLAFWAERLAARGLPTTPGAGSLAFADDEGLGFELVVAEDDAPRLVAHHPEIPAEHAIVGIAGARAYAAFDQVEERVLTDVLGFTYLGEGAYRLDGDARSARFAYDAAPAAAGRLGAGTVHHIAWTSQDDDHLAWQRRVRDAGGYVTDVQDRDYFRAIYFREPRGVLFELATVAPGFAVDEAPEHLGEELRLPAQHAHLRARLERELTPLVNPRTAGTVAR